jgi:DNA-binding transcriptional LysR family regulator
MVTLGRGTRAQIGPPNPLPGLSQGQSSSEADLYPFSVSELMVGSQVDTQELPAYSQPMDWGKLQAFIVLARSANLERASRTLGIDGTTVSRKVRALELELGHTLFERSRDGQVLTADGRRLFVQAEKMERAALEFTDDTAGAERGLVRVSAAEGFGTRFVAPRLLEFAREHPNISVDLYANSGFLSPSRKEADIALLLAQPRKGPLKTRKLTDYSLGLYIAKHLSEAPDDIALIGYIPDFIYAGAELSR